MRFQVLSLFPELVRGYFGDALLARALRRRVLELELFDIRAFSEHPQGKVDARPYGGGPGMVLRCEPIAAALEAADAAWGEQDPGRRIFLSPQGRLLADEGIRKLAAEPRLVLLCGRYEGVDRRVLDAWQFEEVSIGDYVLAGGELPALVLIEAVTRWLPGALSRPDSARRDALSAGRLGFAQYTRPPSWRGHEVPEVLLEGAHQKVAHWRRDQAQRRSRTEGPGKRVVEDGSHEA